jgi:hypothetical protein
LRSQPDQQLQSAFRVRHRGSRHEKFADARRVEPQFNRQTTFGSIRPEVGPDPCGESEPKHRVGARTERRTAAATGADRFAPADDLRQKDHGIFHQPEHGERLGQF